MVTIRAAEPLDGYVLRLRFSDGLEGALDLEPFLWGPMFEPLRDLAYFRRVRVSSRRWNRGLAEWSRSRPGDPPQSSSRILCAPRPRYPGAS